VRAALLIATKDLRQRARDRSALVLGFVAPLAIAALMSVAFSGTTHFHARLAVVDNDHSPLGSALVGVLRSPDLAAVASVRQLAEADARSAVTSGAQEAALILPAGFSAAATGPGPVPPIEVIANPDHLISGRLAEAVAQGFVAQLNADRLSVQAAVGAGATAPAAELARRASALQLPETVVDRPSGQHELDAISYFAPAMGMFFLFFAIGFGARGFWTERREGTLDRLAVAPVRPSTILAGKALSIVVYGLASMTVMWLVTSLFFGARWGNPVAVALLIVDVVLAVVALAALVITWARTERQVDSLSSVAVFGLTIIGGNFFFISAAPTVMRRLALVTPNGWALRGFIDLATTSGGPRVVVAPLLAILTFTVVVGALAAAQARRLVVG